MSNSIRHALQRRTRAEQMKKERRMHRNAIRNKHPLIREGKPLKFDVKSVPPVKLAQPVAPPLSKDEVLALRKKPWHPWWKKLFGKEKY
jgi:hypothetical protein